MLSSGEQTWSTFGFGWAPARLSKSKTDPLSIQLHGVHPELSTSEMDKKQEPNMRIYITFCPLLALDDYYRSDCFRTAPSCYQYVANNPSAYQNAYWLINHIKVYEQSGEVAMNDTDTIPTIQSPE